MAAYPAVHEGTGATITFGTNTAYTAEIIDIKRTPRKYDALDATKLTTTTSKEYIRSTLAEPGELDLTVHWNPDIPFTPNTGETVTITYPVIGSNATASTDASSGFVLEYNELDIAVGKIMMSKVKIKLTGSVTHVNTAT
jgi:hypothetical protein